MLSLATHVLGAFESMKIPSWVPWRWRHLAVDNMFYDTSLFNVKPWEWIDAYLSGKPMPEGGLIVVQPGRKTDPKTSLEIYDVRDFLEKPLHNITTIVVAGCGSSRVGTIAFGRTVANALDEPVASVIAGYGIRDVIGEALSGAFIFFPTNWILQGMDAWLHRALGTGHHPYLGLRVYDFSDAVPEAATVHKLLLHHPGRFKTIVGHSKGNLAIAAALHALKFSLDDVDDDHVLEQEFGLSKSATVGKVADPDKTDILTFGCFVSLPHRYGKKGDHVYPSHQYVGNGDVWLGQPGSGPRKILEMVAKNEFCREPEIADERIVMPSQTEDVLSFRPFIGHNVASWNPCHMPADEILGVYRDAKWPKQPVAASAGTHAPGGVEHPLAA